MRLWHEELIQHLPRQQLLGQHRECCALRGKGWGKPHSVVNYVFEYPPARLVAYHWLVMEEMEARGYRVTEAWKEPTYRGQKCEPWPADSWEHYVRHGDGPIYPEHDAQYLSECLENLHAKGIDDLMD